MRAFQKSELVREVAQKTRLPQVLVRLVLNAAAEVIIGVLGRGQRVTWRGFGSFTPQERSTLSPGFLPAEEREKITAYWVLFRPSSTMKKRLRADQTSHEEGG